MDSEKLIALGFVKNELTDDFETYTDYTLSNGHITIEIAGEDLDFADLVISGTAYTLPNVKSEEDVATLLNLLSLR